MTFKLMATPARIATAEQMITEEYSLDAVLPRMLQMYEDARNTPPPSVELARTARPGVATTPMMQEPVLTREQPRRRSPFLG